MKSQARYRSLEPFVCLFAIGRGNAEKQSGLRSILTVNKDLEKVTLGRDRDVRNISLLTSFTSVWDE